MKKSCKTCVHWQGRHPYDAKSWGEIDAAKIECAAYCELLDGDWKRSDDSCRDYEMLPGADDPSVEGIEEGSLSQDSISDDAYREVHCDNVLELCVSVAPEKGSRPLRYGIAHIVSPAMPFIGDLLYRGIQDLTKNDSNKESFKQDIEEYARKFLLEKYGLYVAVVAKLRLSEAVEKKSIESNYAKCINAFVDFGSTNSKWIVTDSDKSGKSYSFLDISVLKPTKELCAEWHIVYDKVSAYELSQGAFISWLGDAVLRVVCKFQMDYNACVINILWAFPRLREDLKFDEINEGVNDILKQMGVNSRFELVPEALALSYMFKDRLTELAKACEEEMAENGRRKEKEKENQQYNKEEKAHEEDSIKKREDEAAAWRRDHWVKDIFGVTPEISIERYFAKATRCENLGRVEKLNAFWNTGANGSGKFNLLILDAGGSTLDYYYMAAEGEARSGSYVAGGSMVTERLSVIMDLDDLNEAENRKLNLSIVMPDYPALVEATTQVYSNVLNKISNDLPEKSDLCVVVTGLAMLNGQLRKQIVDAFSLKQKRLIFSPDMVELLPEDYYKTHPMFKRFRAIVCHEVPGKSVGMKWPGGDVAGGMYFMHAKED